MDENDQSGYELPPETLGEEPSPITPVVPKRPLAYGNPSRSHVYVLPQKQKKQKERSRRGLLALALAVVSVVLSLTLIALLETFLAFITSIFPAVSLAEVTFVLLLGAIISLAVSCILAVTAINKRLGRYYGIAALALNLANIVAAAPAVLLLGRMLHLF